jgi:hypothetical protein
MTAYRNYYLCYVDSGSIYIKTYKNKTLQFDEQFNEIKETDIHDIHFFDISCTDKKCKKKRHLETLCFMGSRSKEYLQNHGIKILACDEITKFDVFKNFGSDDRMFKKITKHLGDISTGYSCKWRYNDKKCILYHLSGNKYKGYYILTCENKIVSVQFDDRDLQSGDIFTHIYYINGNIMVWNNGDVSSVIMYKCNEIDNGNNCKIDKNELVCTFIDNDGMFKIPSSDTLIFLRNDQINEDEYKLLEVVFCHVIKQKSYITIYISHECSFLSDFDIRPEDVSDYVPELELDKKIVVALAVIKRHFSNEYIVWKW